MEVMETDTVKMGTEASTPSGEGASGDSPTRQQSAATQHQMKLIKPLLSSASRLGKALAELFGLLVKVRLYKLFLLFALFFLFIETVGR